MSPPAAVYSITVQAISDNLSDSPRLPSPASYPVTIATADAGPILAVDLVEDTLSVWNSLLYVTEDSACMTVHLSPATCYNPLFY